MLSRNMTVRAALESDLDGVRALIAADIPGAVVTTTKPERFDAMITSGEYRPAWIRVAVNDGGDLIAAAVFWGFPQGLHSLALDALVAVSGIDEPAPMWAELIRSEIGARVDAEPMEYHVFLPGTWRGDEAIETALAPRLAAAADAGLIDLLERFRYEWTADMGAPARSARLELRPEPDDAAWVKMFAAVADGTLDVTTKDEVRRLGVLGYAEAELSMYAAMPGDRSWWRFAYDKHGELVGFAMPSRNNGGPVVGYLGVLPGHRGHGYADDLLAEITADLAAYGAERIVADTDATNLPMAAAFDRAGYHRFGIRLVASARTKA